MNKILLDTRLRTSGDPENCEFIYSQPKVIGDLKNVKLVFAKFFNTLYNVTAYNNKIYITENSTDKTATLTNGLYNATEFATMLTSALNTMSGGYATYTVAISATTNKLTLTSTQNFDISTLSTDTASARLLIGFTTPVSGTTNTYTGDSVINLQTDPTLNLRIDGDITLKNYNVIGSGFQPVHFQIDNSASDGDLTVSYYNQTNQHSSIDSSGRISKLRLVLLDSYGRLAALNGGHYQVLLEFY